MNYTEPAKEVLKKAEKIARELDHPYVGTEHLLLAFMRVWYRCGGTDIVSEWCRRSKFI